MISMVGNKFLPTKNQTRKRSLEKIRKIYKNRENFQIQLKGERRNKKRGI